MKTKWLSKTASYALAFCLILIVADLVSAQIPETITYQGRLRGQAGLINDTLDMTFKIYDSQNAPLGQELWSETHPGVVIANGEFTVSLGSIVTFASAGLEFDTQYFLGITVDTDNEMHPRMPFTSVGYAMHALRAQNADHSNNAENSNKSEHSNNSDHSAKADEADYATSAGAADHATTADHATIADHATTADSAATAVSSGTATDALHAGDADHAMSANYAETAGSAATAGSAGFATDALHADEADHAMEAGRSTESENAEFAVYARGLFYRGVAVVSPEFVDDSYGPGYYTDPVAALNDIDVWCGEPSSMNPCLVKIMPGNYFIDNEPVTGPAGIHLEPHVSLEGSGRESTIIRSPYEGILAKDNNDIRHLTFEASPPSFNVAVRVEGAATISDVNIIASGVGIDNVGDLHLNDANIGAEDAGIVNSHKIRMHSVDVHGYYLGLIADGPDAFTEIFDSKIFGENYSLENGEGSGLKIIGSSLISEDFDDLFDPSLPNPTMPAVCAGSIFEDSHGDTYLLDKNCEKIIP